MAVEIERPAALRTPTYDDPQLVYICEIDGKEWLLIELKHNSETAGSLTCAGRVDVWVESHLLGDQPPRDAEGEQIKRTDGFCFGCDNVVDLHLLTLKAGLEQGQQIEKKPRRLRQPA